MPQGAPSTSTLSADVAIAGGGVAGSSLAAALAAAGLGVVVVERAARFRDRVRGEGLHPWGAAEADRLGLLATLREAGARELPLWQRYAERTPQEPYRWADDTPGGHAEWTIFHPTLQEALLAEAARRGARVLRPARVAGLGRDGRPALAVATADGPLQVRARLVVGADGRASAVRRWLGIPVARDPVHHLIGGCLLDGVALAADRTHQAVFPGGNALVFPQGMGRARAYVIAQPALAAAARGPGGAAAFIALCAAALPEGALTASVPLGPAAFFPGADSWSARLTGDSALLIGDAAGANDPSLGHGLSLSFRDARELRDLLCAEADWVAATAEFAARRTAALAVLRAQARWTGPLLTETGPAADARRARVARAREIDPTGGGFAEIFARGPDGLVPDEAARRHFLGEDLGQGP